MSKIKYPGILNEPMVFHAPSMAAALLGYEPSKDRETANEKSGEQFFSRVIALFEYYKIDLNKDGAAMLLALALAQDHVPGFKYKDINKRGRGRPGKWKGFKSIELYADVKQLANQGHSDLNACRILAENPKYRERYEGETAENLHRRYLDRFEQMDPQLKVMSERVLDKHGPEFFIHEYALREK